MSVLNNDIYIFAENISRYIYLDDFPQDKGNMRLSHPFVLCNRSANEIHDCPTLAKLQYAMSCPIINYKFKMCRIKINSKMVE